MLAGFVAVAVVPLAIIGGLEFGVEPTSEDIYLGVVGTLTFTGLGIVILGRLPGHGVGRICLGVGMALGVSMLLRTFAAVLSGLPGPFPPVGAIAAVVSSNLGGLALLGGAPLVLARFPDGRRVGRLGATTEGLLVVAAACLLFALFRPGPLEYGWVEPVDNPLAVNVIAAPIIDLILIIGFITAVLTYGLSLAIIARRYRRADAVGRAQIRWVLAASGLTLVLMVALLLSSGIEWLNELVWKLWVGSFVLPPIAIGIAVLRYRLYEIDRLISRGLSYALLSGALAIVFGGLVLGLQAVLGGVTQGETLAVAASTLVAFALFQPLRRRIQTLVDRRFNRARYDAERVAASFADRLRDEVELDAVADRLGATVRQAVAPESAAIWLRARNDLRTKEA